MPNSYYFENTIIDTFTDSLGNVASNASWITLWWNLTGTYKLRPHIAIKARKDLTCLPTLETL